CTLAFSACGDTEKPHTHTYDKQIAEEQFIKSEATCTQKAVYYFSCECGEKGEETFEYGQLKAHTFDKKVVEDKYLESAATAYTKAVYYFSCECGEMGEETFEYGDVLPPTEGLEYVLNDGGGSYSLKGIGTATDNDIIIASEIDGKPVIAIGERAFEDNKNITSVSIPDSIERIGSLAFRACQNLLKLEIPASVEVIGDSAFERCSALRSITVDKDNPKFKNENNCLLTKNGETLKLGCYTSVIPEGVKTIGIGAFEGCSALTEIVIPDSVKTIAFRAFYNCEKLKSINIPDSVETIGQYAFTYCTALESVNLSNSITLINNDVFYGCKNLTSITIPEGVESIRDDAFAYSGLVSISIPASVTSIGRNTFQWCVDLIDINYRGTVEQWGEISLGNNWNQYTDDYTVTCSDGKINKY
ncbi:MAG: leucine-rich repeat domain-containing protein, partial [Clostridia bacterium]|nr:leucine-rich repeat domain-containing protein [Clostridia bacterium]